MRTTITFVIPLPRHHGSQFFHIPLGSIKFRTGHGNCASSNEAPLYIGRRDRRHSSPAAQAPCRARRERLSAASAIESAIAPALPASRVQEHPSSRPVLQPKRPPSGSSIGFRDSLPPRDAPMDVHWQNPPVSHSRNTQRNRQSPLCQQSSALRLGKCRCRRRDRHKILGAQDAPFLRSL